MKIFMKVEKKIKEDMKFILDIEQPYFPEEEIRRRAIELCRKNGAEQDTCEKLLKEAIRDLQDGAPDDAPNVIFY